MAQKVSLLKEKQSIPELQKFRQKYPQYNDLDDTTIANKLAKQYPDAYADLPSKLPTFKFGGGKTRGAGAGRPFDTLGEKIYAETGAPLMHGISSFALGVPKAVAQKTGVAETLYPEQKTRLGKTLRVGAEGAGLFFGGATKGSLLALKGVTKAIPRLAGKGVLKAAAKGAILGGTAGALQTPEVGEGVLRLKERKEQARQWGTFGGAVPIGIAGTGKVMGLITKSGRWIAKNIGGITDASVKIIKRLGADRVFDPLKAKADYVVQDIMPRMKQKLQRSVKEFSVPMQNFAKDKLKVPQSAINTIKKQGTEKVNMIRNFYDDSTDLFYRRIQKGFELKRSTADKAYQEAMSAIPDKTIMPIKNTFYTLRGILKKYKFIDNQGNLMSRASTIDDPVYKKMIGLYNDMKKSIVYSGKQKATGAVLKTDFEIYRDMLGRLYKERPTDRWISKVRNSLYDDAERAGMKGLQKARALEREAFQAEEKLLKSKLISEKRLDAFQKLSQEDIRQLREIEKYTEYNFVNDLNALTSSRYLDKLQQYNSKKIATDLLKAKNPDWTKYIEKEYKNLLGEKNINDIWDDLMAHFANIDFDLVTETPRPGGGFHPSLAGISKSIIGKGAKQYYKHIAPTLGKLKATTTIPAKKLRSFIK